MDALRAKVAEIVEHEKELLDERARASAAAARTATTTAVVGFGANLFLLAAAAVTLRRRAVERERAAAQLHEEKERFRTTLSSIGDAVIVTDVKGRITLLNPTASRCSAGTTPRSGARSTRSSTSSTKTRASRSRVPSRRCCATGRSRASQTTRS